MAGVLEKRNAPDTPPGTGAFHTSKQSGGAHGAVYKVRTPVASSYGEGWMPGAAEDLRPGGLPKVLCVQRGRSHAGRGVSPLGGEGRGKTATPLPDRKGGKQQ